MASVRVKAGRVEQGRVLRPGRPSRGRGHTDPGAEPLQMDGVGSQRSHCSDGGDGQAGHEARVGHVSLHGSWKHTCDSFPLLETHVDTHGNQYKCIVVYFLLL